VKALSLWQPWASAIAVGAKTIETRSWSTGYRGPLLIHASKRLHQQEFYELITSPAFAPIRKLFSNNHMQAEALIPRGKLIAVAELVGCFQFQCLQVGRTYTLDDKHEVPFTVQEQLLGDFSPGRFGWVLRDVRQLPEPIPYRGRQGLFDVPDKLIPEELRG